MAKLLASRQVSARELMQAHLARIEQINPKVNAIVTLVAERALADAARADDALAAGRPAGVLHGLPVAHKDLVDTAGIRTTLGSVRSSKRLARYSIVPARPSSSQFRRYSRYAEGFASVMPTRSKPSSRARRLISPAS